MARLRTLYISTRIRSWYLVKSTVCGLPTAFATCLITTSLVKTAWLRIVVRMANCTRKIRLAAICTAISSLVGPSPAGSPCYGRGALKRPATWDASDIEGIRFPIGTKDMNYWLYHYRQHRNCRDILYDKRGCSDLGHRSEMGWTSNLLGGNTFCMKVRCKNRLADLFQPFFRSFAHRSHRCQSPGPSTSLPIWVLDGIRADTMNKGHRLNRRLCLEEYYLRYVS